MLRTALLKAAAGAVATAAPAGATYAGVVARARLSSSVPSEVAGELAGRARVDLAGSDGYVSAQNRKTVLNMLRGIIIGVGTAYGLVRSYFGRSVSMPRADAMAGSDVLATAPGTTDSPQSGLGSWASDIVPHLARGLTMVAARKVFAGS